jgi:hypothetical protein
MTRLGTARQCAKQGRYARTMGNHWRSSGREKLSFAANGLLMDIWSYCADQATATVSTLAMQKLTASDRKNASRMLNQLVSGGYVARATEGWSVLEWEVMNPIAQVSQLRPVDNDQQGPRRGSEVGSEEAETPPERLAQRKPPLENIEERTPPLKTQDPGPIKKEEGDTPPSSPPAEPEPSPQERIRQLEAAYDAPTLLADTRDAVALSRKNGKVADSVWLTTLTRLAAFPPAVALDAMRLFTEHHADGDKREEYLVGIARNTARRLSEGRINLRKTAPEPRRTGLTPEERERGRRMFALLGGEAVA